MTNRPPATNAAVAALVTILLLLLPTLALPRVNAATGYGIKLDGVNSTTGDYVNTNINNILQNGTSTLTVTAWVKHAAQGNGQILASLRDSQRVGMFFHVTEGDPPGDPATTDRLELRFYTANTFGGLHTPRGWISSALKVPHDGQWTFVGVTFNGTMPYFYVNNQVEGGAKLGTPVGIRQNTVDNYYIGWRQAAGSGYEHFNGSIADVRVYQRVLSSVEMLSLSNNLCVDPTGMRAHYAMTEGTGTATAEATGTFGAATLVNGPTWESSPASVDSCLPFTPTVVMDDQTASYPVLVSRSTQNIAAEWTKSNSILAGKKIDSITLALQRMGPAKGIAEVAVFDVNKNIKKLFGTVDVGTLPRSGMDIKTFTISDTYTIAPDDRIGIRFNGGSSKAGVGVWMDGVATDTIFDGQNSQSISSVSGGWYVSDTNQDMYMILKQTHS